MSSCLCWGSILVSLLQAMIFRNLRYSSSSSFLCFNKFFFLAALGPGSLFGLVTFSHKIGFYDVQGPIPVVKNIFIPQESDGTIPIELEDAMPLLSFLAPVC